MPLSFSCYAIYLLLRHFIFIDFRHFILRYYFILAIFTFSPLRWFLRHFDDITSLLFILMLSIFIIDYLFRHAASSLYFWFSDISLRHYFAASSLFSSSLFLFRFIIFDYAADYFHCFIFLHDISFRHWFAFLY